MSDAGHNSLGAVGFRSGDQIQSVWNRSDWRVYWRDLGMSSDDDDHGARFLRDYERYQSVKQRGGPDIRLFALRTLVQIHHLSGASAAEDRNANIKVMHRLLGRFLDESDVQEMYDELRRDAFE